MRHFIIHRYNVMIDNYEKPEDFISDESFVSWFYKTDEKNIQQWNMWLQSNPGKKPLVEEATTFLSLINAKENPVGEEQLLAAEKQLRSSISTDTKVVSINRNRFWYVAAAAVVIILLVTTGIRYFTYSNKQ